MHLFFRDKIPAVRKLRQEDNYGFTASLAHRARPNLKNRKTKHVFRISDCQVAEECVCTGQESSAYDGLKEDPALSSLDG